MSLDTPTVLDIEGGECETQPKSADVEEITQSKAELKPVKTLTNEARHKSASTVVLSSEHTPVTSCESSTVVSAQSTPSRYNSQARKNTFSSLHSLGSASTISIRSSGSGKSKPPNVLVYSESQATTDHIKAVLNDTLHRHK